MKNLFSESLSNKKWAIIIASFIAFIALIGILMFEGTKKTVALTIEWSRKES